MKTSRLFLFAAMIAPLCRADDGLALAAKYLDLTGTPAFLQLGFESGIKSSLDRMRAQGAPDELVDSIQSEAHGFFLANFKWDEVKPKLAKLYADTFTEAELKEIDAFYETAAGQKAVAKLPNLMQEGSQIAMSGVQAKMPEFQQRVAAMIQSYKSKQAAAAQTPAPGAITVPAVPTK